MRPPVAVVAVAVTDGAQMGNKTLSLLSSKVGVLVALLAAMSAQLQAAVLPEERADVLYSTYSGGGVDIKSPMVLVRLRAHSPKQHCRRR